MDLKNVLSMVVDIGNSNITLGLFKGNDFVDRFDYPTRDFIASFDKAEGKLSEFLEKYSEYNSDKVEGALISSVVPNLTRFVQLILKHATGVDAKVMTPDMWNYIKMDIDDRKEVGGDLVAAIAGAIEYYSCPCVIADLGTICKFLLIDKNKAFIGASFSPGTRSMFTAMDDSTALLPSYEETGASPKDSVAPLYGKNTIQCMKAGIYWSVANNIDRTLWKMKEELGEDSLRIVTGGYTDFILNGLGRDNYTIDKNLVLRGINVIYFKNRK